MKCYIVNRLFDPAALPRARSLRCSNFKSCRGLGVVYSRGVRHGIAKVGQMYRIKDWSDNFENNRTRELKNLSFVCIPNKLDGDGYTELIDHPDGASHYGAWVTIVHVASRCGIRGTLSRGDNKAHDSSSLARITRIPKVVFDGAIPRLIQIGWIEDVSDDCETTCTIPHDAAGKSQDSALNRTEGNRTEGKINTPVVPKGTYSPSFGIWWSQYPKSHRTGKEKAYRSYQKAGKRLVASGKTREEAVAFLNSQVVAFAASPKGNSEFVPAPSVWLNQGRYHDDPAAWQRADKPADESPEDEVDESRYTKYARQKT